MNKDQVKGRMAQAAGKVKEVAGKVVGNQKLRTQGDASQAKGKLQSDLGDAREDVKDAAKGNIDKL